MEPEPPRVWFQPAKLQCVAWNNFKTAPLTLLAGGSADQMVNRIFIWSYATKQTLPDSSFSASQPRDQEPELLASTPVKGSASAVKFINKDRRLVLLAATSTGSVSLFATPASFSTQDAKGPTSLAQEALWKDLHQAPVTTIDYHSARGEIATGGEDGRLSLLRTENWKADISLRTGASVHQALYLSEAELAAACAGSEVQCWDLRTNMLAQSLRDVSKAVGWCHSVSDHPTQPMFLAAGHSDGAVLLWDRRKIEYPLARLKQHSADVWSVRFHPTNPDRLISCSGDGTVLQWEFNPHKESYGGQGFRVDENNHVVTEILRVDGGVNSFDIGGRDGETLAAVSENETLCFVQLPQ